MPPPAGGGLRHRAHEARGIKTRTPHSGMSATVPASRRKVFVTNAFRAGALVLQERKARRRCLGEWEDDCARCGDGSGLRVLCGYCHLVFHPTCLDPLTGVENWDELAELNAIEYAVKYATKTKPGDYVIDCAPPVAGCAAAAAAVAASEGGRCFTKYKECPLSAYAAAAAAVTAPLGTPGNERGSATAACTCGGTRPQRRRSRRPAAASSKAPQVVLFGMRGFGMKCDLIFFRGVNQWHPESVISAAAANQ